LTHAFQPLKVNTEYSVNVEFEIYDGSIKVFESNPVLDMDWQPVILLEGAMSGLAAAGTAMAAVLMF